MPDADAFDDPFEDPDTPLLADDDVHRLHDVDDVERCAVSGEGAMPPPWQLDDDGPVPAGFAAWTTRPVGPGAPSARA